MTCRRDTRVLAPSHYMLSTKHMNREKKKKNVRDIREITVEFLTQLEALA